MAKLQGHFLKYKGKLEESVSHAKEIMDIEMVIDEMTVLEWLARLNKPQFAKNFYKENIRRV